MEEFIKLDESYLKEIAALYRSAFMGKPWNDDWSDGAQLEEYIKDVSGYFQGRFFMGRDPVEHAKRAKYKPPAMRVRGVCSTKKSPFRYNEVVQANL